MKLYVKAYSSYRSDLEEIALKKELKSHYKLDTRRQDDFIHYGLLGAMRLKEQSEISPQSELYITSGYGNLNILQKTNNYVLEEKESIKLFDFINMLGNTTSYYVASQLGIKAKSIFQISDNFTYFHSLITIYASLMKSKKEVVFGAIDVASQECEVIKRIANIDKSVSVVSSVNYQLLSLDATDAQASIEFDTRFYRLDELQELLKHESCKIVCSMRCDKLEYEKPSLYFETYASYLVNEVVEKGEDAIYIECYEEQYKILKIVSLK